MRLFGGRRGPARLEQQLLDDRPAPRSQLVDDVVRRTEACGTPARRSARLRYGLAVALCLAFVAALASFGALSPAKKNAVNAASATVDAAVTIVSKPTSGLTGAADDSAGTPTSNSSAAVVSSNGQPASSAVFGNAGTGQQQNAKFSTRFLATIGTYVTNSWICHWNGGDYTSSSAASAGNWTPIQLTSMAIYTAHTGDTFDIGPDPSFTTAAACASAAAANSPSVTINQAGGQADPTNTSPINFTVVFSQSVGDFATGDVSLSGTAGATTATVTGGGTTYNVAVSGMTGSGTVIATVAAGVAHNAAGYANFGSTSTDNSVLYDVTVPTVSVTQGTACPNGSNGWCNALDPATITINVSGSDSHAGVTNLTCTDSIAPTSPTVTGQSGSNPRTGSFTVSAAGVHNISCTSTDGVGNTSAAGTLTVKIDRTAPTLSSVACVFNSPGNRQVSVTGSSADANTPSGTPPTITYSSTSSNGGAAFTWSSPTVTFSAGTTWNFASGSSSLGTNNKQYTVTVTSKDPAGNPTSASPASCTTLSL